MDGKATKKTQKKSDKWAYLASMIAVLITSIVLAGWTHLGWTPRMLISLFVGVVAAFVVLSRAARKAQREELEQNPWTVDPK